MAWLACISRDFIQSTVGAEWFDMTVANWLCVMEMF